MSIIKLMHDQPIGTQTGVKIEKDLLKVLKAVSEYREQTLGDLLEDIIFNSLEGTTTFTEDDLDAIKKFINIYMPRTIAQRDVALEDTVIFPANEVNFKNIFQNGSWHSINIANFRHGYLKYAACYRNFPVSGITHFAEIKSIVKVPNSNKVQIIFKDQPIAFDKPIEYAGKETTIRSRFYTNFNKLKDAKNLKDVFGK